MLKRYLLGDLGSAAQERLESLLMTEKETFEELCVTEDELIDAYIHDELDEDEKARFESHFLSTLERQRQVRFASALREHVESATVPEAWEAPKAQRASGRVLRWIPRTVSAPAWGVAMAASLLLVVLGGWAALFVGNQRLESRLEQVTAELGAAQERQESAQRVLSEERAQRIELAQALEQAGGERATLEQQLASLREQARAALSRPAAAASVAAVWLVPGLLRGMGEVERVILPADASLARLHLDLGIDDYASYRAALHDDDGEEIWTQSQLEATTTDDRVAVTLVLPAEILPDGDYHIRLSGVPASGELELVGRYYFRVLQE